MEVHQGMSAQEEELVRAVATGRPQTAMALLRDRSRYLAVLEKHVGGTAAEGPGCVCLCLCQ